MAPYALHVLVSSLLHCLRCTTDLGASKVPCVCERDVYVCVHLHHSSGASEVPVRARVYECVWVYICSHTGMSYVSLCAKRKRHKHELLCCHDERWDL